VGLIRRLLIEGRRLAVSRIDPDHLLDERVLGRQDVSTIAYDFSPVFGTG